MKRSRTGKQSGFETVIVILIAVALAIIGFVAWRLWSVGQDQATISTESAQSVQPPNSTEEVATLMVNGYKLTYPVNENNKQVVVDQQGNVAYSPIRQYYAQSNSADCKQYINGRLAVGKLGDLFESVGTSFGVETVLEKKQTKVDSLIAEGKVIKIKDVYVLEPTKQNELCDDIYNNDDPALEAALGSARQVQVEWFNSMTLEQ